MGGNVSRLLLVRDTRSIRLETRESMARGPDDPGNRLMTVRCSYGLHCLGTSDTATANGL